MSDTSPTDPLPPAPPAPPASDARSPTPDAAAPPPDAAGRTPDAQPLDGAGPTPRVRISFKRRLREAFWLLMVCLAGLVGSAFMCYGYGGATYRWRGLDVQVRLVPSLRGETRLVFAPLGEVRATTHRTPVTLSISLREVSFEEVRRFLQSPPEREKLEEDFRSKARGALTDFAVRQILLGALGAVLVPLLLRLKRARYYTLSALTGGAFVAIVFFHAAGSFNPRAFASPTYTGSLQKANWIIDLVKDGFMRAEVLSERLKRVAGNLNALYGRIESIPGVSRSGETIKILHISDIHNNPAAVSFVKELAEKAGVDIVIDTGDLSDYGLPIEANLTKALGELKMPYLFVAGNHDSQATIRGIHANRNAVILRDAPVTVAGLTVLGAPDPSSARPDKGSVDTPNDTLAAAAQRLLEAFQAAPVQPDIVCVHNPRQAETLIGKAKVVLCGHMHAASVEDRQGTIVSNAGTTGAAGVRYFERREGVPFTANLLFFSKTDRRLLYVDRVELAGNLGSYSLIRKSFESEEPVSIEAAP